MTDPAIHPFQCDTLSVLIPMPTERVAAKGHGGERVSGHRPGGLPQRPVQHPGPPVLPPGSFEQTGEEGEELYALARTDSAAGPHALFPALHSRRPASRRPACL